MGELLSQYRDKKVLIFSRYVDIVREVSRRYLIPHVVAETSGEERRAGFKNLILFVDGKYADQFVDLGYPTFSYRCRGRRSEWP